MNKAYADPKDMILKNIAIDKNTSCWEWTRHRHTKGYGRIQFCGRMIGAHRVSYMLLSNPSSITEIPDGMMVCHHCDNPGCVNPSHLFLGTHLDNMKDMCAKGRHDGPSGSSHHSSVLDEIDIVVIKRLLDKRNVSHQSIAGAFGVGQRTITDIASGKTWANIGLKPLAVVNGYIGKLHKPGNVTSEKMMDEDVPVTVIIMPKEADDE